MGTEFFVVKTPAELCQALESFPRLPPRRAALDEARGAVLARELVAREDLPDADRSTMDGFAVQAADTFGASDSSPLPLELVGSIAMGELSALTVGRGQAAHIPTGGYLPDGADAVLMKEHASAAGPSAIEVSRPVTTGENVLLCGEDLTAGEVILPAGRRLEPWDIGLLAAQGITEVEIGTRPRVRVLSTGDELVPIESKPAAGQIRDANAHAVAALLRANGCAAEIGDIVADRAATLRAALEEGLRHADLVVLSGGSSVGEKDLMPSVVSSLGAEVLLHGVAMRPGKPTLLARAGDKAIFGLPGHPVSALVVAHVFLVTFVRYLAGAPMRQGPLGARIRARLATSIHSVRGREEYVRVRLDEGPTAVPLFGKSAMLSSLVRANGYVVVPIQAEGVARGDEVEVVLLEASHG